jgi:hypothetical protein
MVSRFHVATTGADSSPGSQEEPFRTINKAASLARPGDSVIVHAGEYREWVSPARGGTSDRLRITYQAAKGEHVIIKGSEAISDWAPVAGTVWKTSVRNTLFGSFNPFAEEVAGDWIVYADSSAPRMHLGDVYMNGISFYEVSTVDEVFGGRERHEAIDDWTGSIDMIRNPRQTKYVWHAEVGETETTIWANFHGSDPVSELVEINVRRSVFYPADPHIDYITVRGFELAQAATPWTPPTANQPGLIGPSWAKGWVIEDNVIHDAKCSAITIGKESSTGNNFATERRDKPGYQYQIESVFSAQQIGWNREHIGSHIIRDNTIFDCGQNAIVGHLGCIFSTIEDNHIYNIATKREYYGYEIAAIKLHAPIDVEIRHNRIHDCSLGTWLDWQTQGTRLSQNVYYANNRDLFIEVSHGPYLVDHNVLGSRASLENFSQGGAYVNNLLCGTVSVEAVVDRSTPYHVPHSTQVAGYAAIVGGDDRFIGNIFLDGDAALAYGPTKRPHQIIGYGTAAYDGSPTSLQEYIARVDEKFKGDHERYAGVKQPVYIRDNVYAGDAGSYERETGAIQLQHPVTISISDTGDAVYLDAVLPADFDSARVRLITGADLEAVRFAAAEFEERDGTLVVAGTDITGSSKKPGEYYAPGPIGALRSGATRTRIW